MATVRQQIHITWLGEAQKPMDSHRAPFRSVDHALRMAYRLEGDQICKVSSYFADLRAGELRGHSYYDTPWDRHAQAAMVLRFVRERTKDGDLIDCHYRQPRSDAQLGKKWLSVWSVSQRLIRPDNAFSRFCVADWAGLWLPKNWIKDHAKQLNISVRQAYRIRKLIHEELDQHESRALNELEDAMREAGLID